MFVFSPDFSLALVAAGIVLVCCEFVRPGLVIPAVLGCLLVVFGLNSLWQYSLDWRGAVLAPGGFALLAVDGSLRARGAVALLGAAAVFVGCIMLVKAPHVRWPTALVLTLPVSILIAFLLATASRARRNKRIAIL